MQTRAFTLIELLIVVAIIAILAAIAVPNFLEAQTRSKVSRVLADFRSLATAIESYRVDQRDYPTQPVFPLSLVDDPQGLIRLSTPIAYITNPLIRDPFKATGDRSSNNSTNLQYIYQQMVPPQFRDQPVPGGIANVFNASGSFPKVNGKDIRFPAYPGGIEWFLTSYGPDRALQIDDDPQLVGEGRPFSVYMPYDATNGTISDGDVYRFGP